MVGTNYSRVIPSKEINSKDRDSFWKKEEEEERHRIETERGRQNNAKIELEKVFERLIFMLRSLRANARFFYLWKYDTKLAYFIEHLFIGAKRPRST